MNIVGLTDTNEEGDHIIQIAVTSTVRELDIFEELLKLGNVSYDVVDSGLLLEYGDDDHLIASVLRLQRPTPKLRSV